jgi:hypothetical protein
MDATTPRAPAEPPSGDEEWGPFEADPPAPTPSSRAQPVGADTREGRPPERGIPKLVNTVFGAAQTTFLLSVLVMCAVPALAILMFSSNLEHGRWSVFAVGVVISAAGFVSGGLLGFLFALPRSTTVAGSSGNTTVAITVRPNTNLEDVSDWLTKIIVGVTLIQIGKADTALGFLFTRTGDAMGGGPSATTFSACLLVYSFACGLMGGWVATRLFIGRWMQAADQPLAEAQQVARSLGGSDAAAPIRDQRDAVRAVRAAADKKASG